MSESPKKISLVYKIVFALTIAFFLLYFIMFLVFGLSATKINDADLKGGLGDVFKYHFSGVKGLFSFSFLNAGNVIYFSLSGLLYFFLFITLLYIVVGVIFIVKRKRKILIPGLVASLLVIYVYIMVATGTQKYWYIINQRAPFDHDNSLIGPTFGLLIFSVFYILSAYVLYFYSLFIVIKNPPVVEPQKEEEIVKLEPVQEAPKAEEIPAQETVKPAEPIVEEKPADNDEPVLFEEVNVEEEQAKSGKEEKEDLKSMLAELVRDIVRDEMARNNAYQSKPNNQNQNGFGGGPLIVQYFNTMPVETQRAPQPAQPEPVKQEVKQPVKASAPAPAPKEPEEKNPIIRIPFTERMINADKEMQNNYNELKNEILSYGVNSRVSNSGDTFRLHRKTYVKITIAGLSLKLYFALNPDDYKDSTVPVQNAGHKGIYQEIPLVFKVKSGLSMRRCKQLIQDVFEKNGFEQGSVGNINWVEDLKNAPKDDDED